MLSDQPISHTRKIKNIVSKETVLNMLLFLCLFAVLPWSSAGWISRSQCQGNCRHSNKALPSPSHRESLHTHTLSARLSSIYHGPEDEEECPDEEECEINWDLMPSWDKEDGDERNVEEEKEYEQPEQPADSKRTAFVPVGRSLQGSRVRLEMNWQIDECREDVNACENFCTDCAGSGRMACRFCRGTNILSFDGKFGGCPVCDQGMETCGSCRGTGFIAPWATTMENHLHNRTNP